MMATQNNHSETSDHSVIKSVPLYSTSGSSIILGDCLEVMKQYPNNYFDLVLTDPPYGISIGKMNFTKSTKGGVAVRNDYKGMADWDDFTPTQEYFDEIMRVSKNQVIFGGNYFTDKLPPSSCWIVWDKRVEAKYSNDFADCEMAWTSFKKPSRVIRYLWSGMMQGNMKDKEERKHPTQKPLTVMRQIIEKYTEVGDKILDPFAGSGSTVRAAKDLQRHCVGIEINAKYVDVITLRERQEVLL